MIVRLRPATTLDLDVLAAVEVACFEAPWSREVLAQDLERPIARVVVVELTDTQPAASGGSSAHVAGFACVWHIVDEAHLLRIAVHPQWRRHGCASALLRRVLDDALAAGCVQVDLEVGRSNAAAAALYAGAGFVEVGLRLGYYQHPPDDAVLLRCRLGPVDPPPSP